MGYWVNSLETEPLALVRAPCRALMSIVALSYLALPYALQAQEPRPYRPAFDVMDYALTIDLPDTGATIHANALLSVTRTGKADTLVLDLLDLGVDRVSVDGRAVKFARLPESIVIPLPRKSSKAQYKI